MQAEEDDMVIECAPDACQQIAMAQKEVIRETLPLVVLAGVSLVIKSRVNLFKKDDDD